MARSFPPDVVIIDTDALVHARFGRGKTGPRLVQAKAYRLAADTFTPSMVTPQLASQAALTESLRRMRSETGRWDKVSVLLPDSWFRMNILDLPALPDRHNDALDVVRWSLKRTLPIPPEQLRVSFSVLSRAKEGAKVLVLSALEQTLAAIEATFAAAGLEIVLIEPLGLNIWNAIAVREPETTEDRLFLYVRDTDFTTAVFRGAEPLFIRSRNLSRERTVEQEIRLSANYLRDALAIESFAQCYVAGQGGAAVHDTLAAEFNTKVRPVALRDYIEDSPADVQGDIGRLGAELTACTGVFTG
jgi:type IV pilus assembly protein PilM